MAVEQMGDEIVGKAEKGSLRPRNMIMIRRSVRGLFSFGGSAFVSDGRDRWAALIEP